MLLCTKERNRYKIYNIPHNKLCEKIIIKEIMSVNKNYL